MQAEAIRLREATPDDARAVADIWNPIIRDTAISFWPTERCADEVSGIIRTRLSNGRAFFVAVRGERVLGFATYDQFRGGAGYSRSMEHSINAAPEARGHGVGRLLLRGIEDHARAAGHRLMIGGITASNTASIGFHRAMGYAEWGRIPAAGWKFGEYHDLVFMGRDLQA